VQEQTSFDPDPARLAVEAAELGAWSWHIPTGRLEWTPWTYTVFGHLPGAVATSYEMFLRQVHPEDREGVLAWLEQAIVGRVRSTFEFRIDRPDGSIRLIRSTGRVLPDEHGHLVRMAGVVEDITDQQQQTRQVPAIAPLDSMSGSLSVRQVAHILGVADATVKRIAADGGMQVLRSTRKNSRRFAPEHVIEHLRKQANEISDFVSAAEAEDMNGCLVYLMEQLLAGATLETLLDERVKRATRVAAVPFISELLARMPFMVPERPRSVFPALLVQVGAPVELDSELIACVLRTHGHEVLRPAGAPEARELAELAERVRARVIVLAVGNAAAEVQLNAANAAGAIASAQPGSLVGVYGPDRLRLTRGVTRFRSMRELASVLAN
jgi:phage terminase Nu1 subunit (DNA packaging protein)